HTTLDTGVATRWLPGSRRGRSSLPPRISVHPLDVAAPAGEEVVGEPEDRIAQLDALAPPLRDRVLAQERAEDVAGDRAGAVAVAGVVDGEADAGGEVVACDEGAVDGDGE